MTVRESDSSKGAVGTCSAVEKAADVSPADVNSYQLVWSDEFSKGGALDPHDWGFERGFARNKELQWYQPQNAYCVDGHLVIEARREQVANPSYDPNSNDWRRSRRNAEYTSASVTTNGHHAWLYGRFEIRGRFNPSAGSWPAFWTLGTTRQWPACGEVDIMEFYKNELLANVGWAKKSHETAWNSTRQPLTTFNDSEWSKRFHTWRMDWDENRISLYVDDQLLNNQDLAKTLNEGRPDDNPFHRPMYLILNQAIGANGGDPSQTSFPIKLEIDYVRVYQTPSQIRG